MQKNLEKYSPALLVIGLLLIWEFICRAFKVDPFILPMPSAIWDSLIEYRGPIATHAWQTFWTTMVGFAISVVVGILLGSLLGSSLGWGILAVWRGYAKHADGTPLFNVSMDPKLLILAAVIATLTGLAAAILPALRASRLEPVVAIRG